MPAGDVRPLTKKQRASILRAFVKVASKKPWLLTEAWERGLEGTKALAYLELGARLLKEIGRDESKAPPQVAIILSAGLDVKKLKQAKIIEASPAALSPAPEVAESSKKR